jgi:hypothetical protein
MGKGKANTALVLCGGVTFVTAGTDGVGYTVRDAGVKDRMLYVMLLAHLLGDYLFQWGFIARWKARSLVGVLAHGVIVTITTLTCAVLVAPSWWPYALLIGLVHTVIDLVRARFLRGANPAWELIWYLLDQLAHMIVIVLVVTWSGAPSRSELGVFHFGWTSSFSRKVPASAGRPLLSFNSFETHSSELTDVAGLLADPRVLAYAIGYLLLLNPAWVFLRLTVRGLWGSDAAPHLGDGEKYGPMVERVLTASCVLTGQFHLVPLVLLPRRLVPLRVQGTGGGVLVRPTDHWAETLMSTWLAVAVGLALRVVSGGG